MVMNNLKNGLPSTQQDRKAHAVELRQEIAHMRQQVTPRATSGGLKRKAAAEVNITVGRTARRVTIAFRLS
jgi:hypothetical protein